MFKYLLRHNKLTKRVTRWSKMFPGLLADIHLFEKFTPHPPYRTLNFITALKCFFYLQLIKSQYEGENFVNKYLLHIIATYNNF
jgi:hypothetical protein